MVPDWVDGLPVGLPLPVVGGEPPVVGVMSAVREAVAPPPPDPPDDDPADWPASFSESVASAAETLSWAEETAWASDVVSSEASAWPAVTSWPTVTSTAETVPATWNAAVAWWTGSVVPETLSVWRTVATDAYSRPVAGGRRGRGAGGPQGDTDGRHDADRAPHASPPPPSGGRTFGLLIHRSAPPGKPEVVQLLPPVDVIRTVEAVTAPVEAVFPKAVTQSPMARSVAAAAWLVV